MRAIARPSRRRKFALTFGSRIVVFAIGAVTSVIVARSLQPAGRGMYAVVVATAGVATAFGHLSVEQANVYLWGARPENRRQLVVNSMLIGAAAGLAASGLALLAVMFKWPIAISVPSIGLLLVALAAVPAVIVGIYLNNVLALSDRIMTLNLVTVVGAVLQCGALAFLGLTHRLTVQAVVVIWTSAMFFGTAVTAISLRPRLRQFSLRMSLRAIGIGLRYHIGMSSLYLLFRVDVLLLSSRTTSTQIGLYAMAVSVAELTYLATDSVAQVVLPLQTSGTIEGTVGVTARAFRANFLVALLGMTALCLLAPWLVPTAFGRSFAGAVAPLFALAPGIVALATTRPLGGYLVRLNRPLLMSSLTTSAMVINVVLNLVLIPRLGIVGSGVASSVAYVLLALSYVTWTRRSSALPWHAFAPTLTELRAEWRRRTKGPVEASLPGGSD